MTPDTLNTPEKKAEHPLIDAISSITPQDILSSGTSLTAEKIEKYLKRALSDTTSIVTALQTNDVEAYFKADKDSWAQVDRGKIPDYVFLPGLPNGRAGEKYKQLILDRLQSPTLTDKPSQAEVRLLKNLSGETEAIEMVQRIPGTKAGSHDLVNCQVVETRVDASAGLNGQKVNTLHSPQLMFRR